jgi:hypothetical protein
MANELLDFVMSLVRDPGAAARYAADPAGALAEADLTDVTSADVNNLLPMVSESLSMGSPLAGGGSEAAGNVWTSGAATAAFDAFSPHAAVVGHPATPVIDTSRGPQDVVADPAIGVDHSADFVDMGLSSEVDDIQGMHPVIDDAASGAEDSAGWDGWGHPGTHGHAHPGFDFFD